MKITYPIYTTESKAVIPHGQLRGLPIFEVSLSKSLDSPTQRPHELRSRWAKSGRQHIMFRCNRHSTTADPGGFDLHPLFRELHCHGASILMETFGTDKPALTSSKGNPEYPDQVTLLVNERSLLDVEGEWLRLASEIVLLPALDTDLDLLVTDLCKAIEAAEAEFAMECPVYIWSPGMERRATDIAFAGAMELPWAAPIFVE